MTPAADTITRRAWADYTEQNRRANVHYAHLPIAYQSHTTPTPCHACYSLTTARSGFCKDCTEKDRP